MSKFAKYFTFSLIFLIILASGCREDIFLYPEENYNNYVYVNSEPVGASIFLKGEYLEETTPAWLTNLEPGRHVFTLKLQGFIDTTFQVSVQDSSKEFITVFLKGIINLQ